MSEIYEWEEGKVLKLLKPEFPDDLAEIEYELSRKVWESGYMSAPQIFDLVTLENRCRFTMSRLEGQAM